MRLYFVRHGETQYSKLNIHQLGTTPLSSTGKKQAMAIADRFKRISVDSIYSSDYTRAKQTAEEIAKTAGKEIVFTKLLRERKRPTELLEKPIFGPYSRKIYRVMEKHADEPNWRHADEENFYDALKRSVKFIKFIEKKVQENIAVVTHAAIMKFIVAVMIFGEEFLTPEIYNRFYLTTWTHNTGITVCEKKTTRFVEDHGKAHSKWHLITWNDHAHLG